MKISMLLPVLAAGFATSAAQTPATPPPTAMTQSAVYQYDQLTSRKFPNGTEARNVLKGSLATGETVAIHASMQPAGTTPSPLHVINHSEMILVQEGTVAFDHDGKSETVTAGGVIYVAMGTMHRVRNIGQGSARYCVIQIGGDIAK